MNETDIQAIMIDNKTINQRIENSLNVIFADIDITAVRRTETACFLLNFICFSSLLGIILDFLD